MSHSKYWLPTMASLLFHGWIFGQFNLQHHYDVGRRIQTSTAEFYSVDSLGGTFGFIDINYDTKHFDKKGATDVWFEIARYFSTRLLKPTAFLTNRISLTVQYNDGIYFFPTDSAAIGSPLNPAWLWGISYPVKLRSLKLPVDLLMRKQHGDKGLTYQITTVWYHSLSRRFATTGFMDIWTNYASDTISIMTEPQLLTHLGNWDIGVEVEISKGFAGAWTKDEEYFDEYGAERDHKIWAIPTIFIKYTF